MKKIIQENRCLYKYKTLYSKNYKEELIRDSNGDIQLNEYTLNMLLNGEICLQSPLKFNDPFDCLVPIKFELSRKKIYNALCKRKDLDALKEKIITDYDNDFDWYYEDFIENTKFPKIKEKFTHEMVDQYGVYCLSKNKDNVLMWSHYAHNHEGICIGIKTERFGKKQKLINLSMTEINPNNQNEKEKINIPAIFDKVHYVSTHKKIKPIKYPTMSQKDIYNSIFQKSKCWKYEQEYRIVAPRDQIEYSEANNNKAGCNKAYIDVNSISEIYFGINTDIEAARTLVKILRKKLTNFENIQFYKMIKNKDHFNLENYKLDSKLIY